MYLPEHVTLCEVCGLVPQDLSIPKWCYRLIGDCTCEPTEDPSTDAQEEGVDISGFHVLPLASLIHDPTRKED